LLVAGVVLRLAHNCTWQADCKKKKKMRRNGDVDFKVKI
jgi:hypothetical protein